MTKTKILFVCLGNICRSPMAEGIFRKLVQTNDMEPLFEIDSAGILNVHQGNLPDARMRQHAAKRAYQLTHRSRQVLSSDFDCFDMIIGMDEDNIVALGHLANSEQQRSKIHRMVDFSLHATPAYIPDPYYGGDEGFENVIDLLEDACAGLLAKLKK